MADHLVTGILRVIHIFSAVAWLGGVFLWNMVIGPRALKNGPPQIRAPFALAVIPAMTRFYMIAGISAIVSGFLLVGALAGWNDYFGQFQIPTRGYGTWLGLGAVAAIGMAIVGFGMTAPAGKKLLETMASLKGPPTEAQQAELMAGGKKLGILGMVAMLFGTIALLGMILAVNAVR